MWKTFKMYDEQRHYQSKSAETRCRFLADYKAVKQIL